MSWLSQGLRALGVLPEGVPQSIDTSGISVNPAAGRNLAGDIASETFSATGPAPVRTSQSQSGWQPLGGSGPAVGPGNMTDAAMGSDHLAPPSMPQATQQQSVVSSDPSQLFAGGDSMFRNFGRQQPGFNVFGPQQGGAPMPSLGQPGQSVLNVNGGGFGEAIRGLGGIAGNVGGAIGDAGGWLMDPDNADTISALTGVGSLAANVYGAYNEGQIMDDERRRRDEEDRRRREARSAMSPMIGSAIRNARGR